MILLNVKVDTGEEFTVITEDTFDVREVERIAKERQIAIKVTATRHLLLAYPREEIEATFDAIEERRTGNLRGAQPPDVHERMGAIEKQLARLAQMLEGLNPPSAPASVDVADIAFNEVAAPPAPRGRPDPRTAPRLGAPMPARGADIASPTMSLIGAAPTSTIEVYDPDQGKMVRVAPPKVGDSLLPLSLKSDL